MVYLLRKQPPQCHCYIWVSWWARCLSLSQPPLCGFACGLAEMNYSSAQRCHVYSFRWAQYKEILACPSKRLELSLPFICLPLSGARSCSVMRVIPSAWLSTSQMRKRLQSTPQLNVFSCPQLYVSHPQGCHRTAHPPTEHQLLQAAWVSANQSAAQTHLN